MVGSAAGQAVWSHDICSDPHHAAAAVDLAVEEVVDTPVDGSDEYLGHSRGIFALNLTRPRSLDDCPDCLAPGPAHLYPRSYYLGHYCNPLDDHQWYCCRMSASA